MYELRRKTTDAWTDVVLAHFDEFLQDHAASERKAQSTAMHFVVRYSDRPALVEAMTDLAIEELEHFRDVFEIMQSRDVKLGDDEKDPYANQLLSDAHSSGEKRLLDRLLIGSIAEYRGCERFASLAKAMEENQETPNLSGFYRNLAAADSRHRMVYVELAQRYFSSDNIEKRLDLFLDNEAEIIDSLPPRPKLH